MEQIGYSLINEKGEEIQSWGDKPGQIPGVPSPIRLPNGDDVHCPELGVEYGGCRLVERWLAAADNPSTSFDGNKVIEYRVPVPRRVRKSTIISRLTDEQLTKAIGMLSVRQAEHWRAPDQPAINENDPEVLAIIKAVGADPALVLAPEGEA